MYSVKSLTAAAATAAALFLGPASATPFRYSPEAAAGAQSYTGDMTYYTPGLGSCGITSADSDAVVAISPAEMGQNPNPNAAPACGKTITIKRGGKKATAKVVDTCPGCASGSIDVSPSVFDKLADQAEGRVSVSWSFS